MQYNDIIRKIKSLADPEAVKGMARFGINPENTYGISIPGLRKMARELGKSHELAKLVTEAQMGSWVQDFNSWDVCDQCCSNLFDQTELAHRKAEEWSQREEEFVKRAGFVLMAALSVHDKKASDEDFIKFLPMIKREATDERNFVKKAVNWALRQIGKRNLNLNQMALRTAEEIQQIDSKSARWIAADAIRELTSEAVQKKLNKKK
jgi:3-methyladenine DNA glycosylase AlkD